MDSFWLHIAVALGSVAGKTLEVAISQLPIARRRQLDLGGYVVLAIMLLGLMAMEVAFPLDKPAWRFWADLLQW